MCGQISYSGHLSRRRSVAGLSGLDICNSTGLLLQYVIADIIIAGDLHGLCIGTEYSVFLANRPLGQMTAGACACDSVHKYSL